MKIIVGITFLFSILVSCQENNNHKESNNTPNAVASGQEIFKKNCAICHGAKGNLGINGAKDLGISTLTIDERITIITNGKGAMTPFKSQLSDAEIKAVAAYTLTLNNK